MYDLKEKINLDLKVEEISQEMVNENNEIQSKDNINEPIRTNKFIVKGEEKLILKKMVIDELGILTFIKNGFTPDNECYYNNKELVLKIECPEGVELTAKRKRNKNKMANYNIAIEVNGIKNEEKPIEGVTYIKRKKYGNYYALIPFTVDNYTLGERIEEKPQNGWKIFKFPLSKEVADEDD